MAMAMWKTRVCGECTLFALLPDLTFGMTHVPLKLIGSISFTERQRLANNQLQLDLTIKQQRSSRKLAPGAENGEERCKWRRLANVGADLDIKGQASFACSLWCPVSAFTVTEFMKVEILATRQCKVM